VPTEEQESERTLVRYRQGLVYDCTRLKNRILKVLDRHGIQYTEGKSTFTQKHWRFLRQQQFAGEEGYTYREHLGMLEFLQARLAEADRRVVALAQSDRYREPVGKLGCLRGIAELSAMVLVTETVDFERFRAAPELMGYWGLGTCEDSSGGRRVQGPITKTGNSHCRWTMVEMAWHYEHPPSVSETLRKRMEGQPSEVVAHAMKAQERLYHKFWRVVKNTGCRQQAAVAVAREATGFVWAIMRNRCGTGATGPA
jgi:transposase